MGEADSLDNAWLVGRGGGLGGTLNSGVRVYGYGDNGKLYSLPPNRNSDDTLLNGTQTPDRPECGAQEPRLRRSGVTGGRYGEGGQEDREGGIREI